MLRPTESIRTVGIISDTHGLVRPEAMRALADSDLIVHAGDIGSPEVLHELETIAPVAAVRGNVDSGAWAAKMPRTEVFEAGGSWFYVLHNLNDLDLDPTAGGFDVVVSGHSRSPRLERRNGCLYVNPGSAGPRRFKLPVAVARLHLNATGFEGELVELEI